MSTDILDAELVEETSTEVATVAPPPPSLFKTDDPAEVVVAASKVADSLKNVLVSQGMIQNIQGKGYVKVEGWQTLASMLGVVPVVAWTREVDGGWEARVEARTLDGRVIGAAESMCTESEGGNWGSRATSNARRSMAQTRAISKALRGPLGFVVTLAGFQATPAEEMPNPNVQQQAPAQEKPSRPIGKKRAEALNALIDDIGVREKLPLALTHVKAESVETLTAKQAEQIDTWLQKHADLKAGDQS